MTVKVLICGEVNGQFDSLLSRLNALMNSAHGPFHFLFIAGALFTNESEFHDHADKLVFPLPTYILNGKGIPESANLPTNVSVLSPLGVGLISISNLTVGYLDESTASPASINAVLSGTQNSGYRGCDLFLSSMWPREIHQFCAETELSALRALGGIAAGSKLVADVANKMRPRYHFATESSRNLFFQRSPYRNEPTATCSIPLASRFIALANVSGSKDKDKKWLHALSLEPIIYLSVADIADIPPGTTDSPYVAIGKVKAPVNASAAIGAPDAKRSRLDASTDSNSRLTAVASSGAPSKFAHLEVAAGAAASGSFFFGRAGTAREGSLRATSGAGGPHTNSAPSSEFSRTLFIGGVTSSVSDRELLKAFPNSIAVRRPGEGKNFVFIEFKDHAAAAAAVAASSQQEVVFGGKAVNIGWGKDKESTSGSGGGDNVRLLQDPVSSDSTTVFVGGLPFVVSQVSREMAILQNI